VAWSGVGGGGASGAHGSVLRGAALLVVVVSCSC
jgi:hypothetical protein